MARIAKPWYRAAEDVWCAWVDGKQVRLARGKDRKTEATRKREHSRKPDEQYEIIEACSAGPFLELFARGTRKGWATWGNQANDKYRPTWTTYAHNSGLEKLIAAE